MKRISIFAIFFVLFLASRIYYIKANTFSSDVKSYARYAYFMTESLNSEKNVYDAYAQYYEQKASSERREKARQSILSRKNIEYPPFAVLWVSLPGFYLMLTENYTNLRDFTILYENAYKWFMLFIDSLFFFLFSFLLTKFLPNDRNFFRSYSFLLSYYILCGACLFIYYYYRLDLTVSFLVLLAATCLFLWKKRKTSFFLLALSINYKLAPLVLVPLWALGSMTYGKTLLLYKQKNWSLLLGTYMKNIAQILGACCLVFLPFVFLFGSKTISFLSYHSDRPIQVESLYSVFVSFLSYFGLPVKTAYTYGSINVFSSLTSGLMPFIPVVMVLGFLALSFFMLYFYMNMLAPITKESVPSSYKTLAEHNPKAFISFISIFFLGAILTFKVLSPQFLLWVVMLLPLCSFTSYESHFKVCLAGLVFSALSSYIYPFAYRDHFVNGGNGVSSFGLFLLTLRNGLMLACILMLIRELYLACTTEKKALLKRRGKKLSAFLS